MTQTIGETHPGEEILFDKDTQLLLTPKFWLLPLYRERIRRSPASEGLVAARGWSRFICKENKEQKGKRKYHAGTLESWPRILRMSHAIVSARYSAKVQVRCVAVCRTLPLCASGYVSTGSGEYASTLLHTYRLEGLRVTSEPPVSHSPASVQVHYHKVWPSHPWGTVLLM